VIVRQLDEDKDWTFGKGRNDYIKDNMAIVQNINTRLGSFQGDCFFNLGAGLDWFNALGEKNQLAINLAISATILNTPNVTGIQQLAINLSPSRNLTVRYAVQTIYSLTTGTFSYNLNGIA
jgi:hypothetical protein